MHHSFQTNASQFSTNTSQFSTFSYTNTNSCSPKDVCQGLTYGSSEAISPVQRPPAALSISTYPLMLNNLFCSPAQPYPDQEYQFISHKLPPPPWINFSVKVSSTSAWFGILPWVTGTVGNFKKFVPVDLELVVTTVRLFAVKYGAVVAVSRTNM